MEDSWLSPAFSAYSGYAIFLGLRGKKSKQNEPTNEGLLDASVCISDQWFYPNNCAPTPPLTQHWP